MEGGGLQGAHLLEVHTVRILTPVRGCVLTWPSMLDFIEGIVRKDMSSLCYSRLDGTTPVMKRNDIVKEFSTNRHKWIFLISTNAGGLGTP